MKASQSTRDGRYHNIVIDITTLSSFSHGPSSGSKGPSVGMGNKRVLFDHNNVDIIDIVIDILFFVVVCLVVFNHVT